MYDLPNQTTRVYIVSLLNAIVAMDVAETIKGLDPHAELVVERRPDPALLAAVQRDRIEMAILEWTPDRLTESGMADVVQSRGGRMVLLGDAAEQAAAEKRRTDWQVLMRPFSTSDLISVIAGPPMAPTSAC